MDDNTILPCTLSGSTLLISYTNNHISFFCFLVGHYRNITFIDRSKIHGLILSENLHSVE